MVTAIAILVILASLAAFMLHVSGTAQMAGVLDLQGARASQAARLGIERGLYEVLQGSGACPAGNQTLTPGGDLNGFTVVWTCDDSTSFNEAGNARRLVQITSTASYGSLSSSDYVERRLTALTER